MLKIVTAPSAVLSEPAKAVIKIDASVIKLISEMKETLEATHNPKGIGLAAPQVGQSLKIFIIKPTDKSPMEVFINPEVLVLNSEAKSPASSGLEEKGNTNKKIKPKDIRLEGCLSLPSIWGELERSDKVLVSYLDELGRQHKRIVKGFPATIVQHEYDHLKGALFPKRVLEQKGKLYKSKKDEKGQDVFEEISI